MHVEDEIPFVFPSTGDPTKDQEIADGIQRTNERISAGLCPNACGPLVAVNPYRDSCEKCGFVYVRNVQRPGLN
jgi:ribosomal protein S27AE